MIIYIINKRSQWPRNGQAETGDAKSWRKADASGESRGDPGTRSWRFRLPISAYQFCVHPVRIARIRCPRVGSEKTRILDGELGVPISGPLKVGSGSAGRGCFRDRQTGLDKRGSSKMPINPPYLKWTCVYIYIYIYIYVALYVVDIYLPIVCVYIYIYIYTHT